MLEVRLLGGFGIASGKQSIALPSRPAQSLFAYLALNAGTSYRREKLAGMLWPDSTDEAARDYLRHALWRIRKALEGAGEARHLQADDLTIRIEPSADLSLDCAIVKGAAQIREADGLMQALEAYGGELLPGFYDEWVVLEREHLQAVFEREMERLLALLQESGRWAEVLEWAEKWIALGQRPEPAYRALMLAHAANGDISKVAATYERCVKSLKDFGVEPSEQTRTLYAEIKAGKRPSVVATAASARPSKSAAASNIPAPLTSFIGRERELKKISELLSSSRLVTLTGPGGVGKTRLAIEAARAARGSFHDRHYWVELAPVSDPAWLPQAVANALGVQGQPGKPLVESLKEFVQDRELLLVVDNCEHMLEACAQLLDGLLQEGSRLRVLATSRESLRIAGEVVVQVQPLLLPQPLPDSAGTISECESTLLFLDRATAVQPDFRISETNASFVAQICRRLDGIPLAIELAAARARGMTVQQIAARLDDRFALLTTGSRAALPRQRTLLATVDWSYDLLSEPERTLFRRLSVFAGGWTLDAAVRVTSAGDLEPPAVQELLPGMVEKSLVTLDLSSGRYDMLETLRAYSLERLKAAGEERDMRNRHLDYWLEFIRQSQLDSAENEESFAALRPDHQNLLAAVGWGDLADGGAQKVLELMGSTRLYWWGQGDFETSYELIRHVLDLPGARFPTRQRQRALLALAVTGHYSGRAAEVIAPLEESLSIAQSLSEKAAAVEVLNLLGMAHTAMGQGQEALRVLREALQLTHETGQVLLAGLVLNNMAEELRLEGKLETALDLYEQSLAFKRQSGNLHSTCIGLLNIAQVAIGLGELPRARARILEALDLIAESRFPERPALAALEASAGFAAALGAWTEAAHVFGAAEAQRQRTGSSRERTDELFIAPLMARAQDSIGQAKYQLALQNGSRAGMGEALAMARAILGKSVPGLSRPDTPLKPEGEDNGPDG